MAGEPLLALGVYQSKIARSSIACAGPTLGAVAGGGISWLHLGVLKRRTFHARSRSAF